MNYVASRVDIMDKASSAKLWRPMLSVMFFVAVSASFFITYAYTSRSQSAMAPLNFTYTFSGNALLFCPTGEPATLRLLYVGNISGTYIIGKNDLLRYVYGTSLYSRVAGLLNGVKRIVLASSCMYNKSLTVLRRGSTLFVYLRASNCETEVPIVLRITGTVNVRRSGSGYLVTVQLNGTPPIDSSQFRLLGSNCLPHSLANRIFKGKTIVFRGSWLVRPGLNGNKTTVVWSNAFLIPYPRTAYEIKHVLEAGIEVRYLGAPLRFRMTRLSVDESHFGGPPRWVTVSFIEADYSDYRFYIGLRRAVLPLTVHPYMFTASVPVIDSKPFYMLIGEGGDLGPAYKVIIEALLNKTVPVEGYTSARVRAFLYGVLLAEPSGPPSLLYHYMYPEHYDYFPVNLQWRNGTRVVLALYGDASYPPWFNPYSVRIGFYGEQSSRECWLCTHSRQLVILLLSSLVAVLLYVAVRRRR